MTGLKSYCDRVIFWPQYGPTCWFNAVLISVFYSQHSRNMLYKKSAEWDEKIEFYRMLRFVLKHKYFKSKNPEKDFKFFDVMKPENVLQMIHKINPKYATENMGTHGAWASIIISKLYKLLGIECLMFEVQDTKLFYDKRNHLILAKKTNTNNFRSVPKPKRADYITNKLNRIKNPSVIIINLENKKTFHAMFYQMQKHYAIPITQNNKDLTSKNDRIFYNGEEYILDSVMPINWNIGEVNAAKVSEYISGHQIAGITCDNEKYVYNGWTRYTVDNAMKNAAGNGQQAFNQLRPCELMKFPWNIKVNNEFCVNTKNCNLPKATPLDHKTKLCFSFSKGTRTLVYIKKDYVSQHLQQSLVNVPDYQSFANYHSTVRKQCPPNNIRNPATNRCIKHETAVKKNLMKPNDKPNDKPKNNKNVLDKKPKECAEGKIRNPLTGRCIKDPKLKTFDNDKIKKPKDKNVLNKKPKECAEGKVRNPLTGRCIKDPKLKTTTKQLKHGKKPCPDGKIRNKLTDRCIKSPYQKALDAHAKKLAKNLRNK